VTRRDWAEAAWLGFALAALFLSPLAFALDGNLYYLQWQPSHAKEVAVALPVAAIGLTGLLVAARRLQGLRGAIALAAVAAVPLLSFGVAVVRDLPAARVLIPFWEHPAIRYGAPLLTGVVVVAVLFTWPDTFRRGLISALRFASPVSLVVCGLFVGPGTRPGPVVATDRPHPTTAGAPPEPSSCSPVLALLFDELSFTYLYDEEMGIRPEFPRLRAFGGAATHHLTVTAPGTDTLPALPGFLAGRRLAGVGVDRDRLMEAGPGGATPFDARARDGLFATARGLGFRTEMVGYYLAYCESLGDLADACRSFSFYNAASPADRFSAWHPLLTTLILWPRQFPLGVLKNPAFAWHQGRLVAATEREVLRPLSTSRPVFRFAHFSVPHLPFAFDRHGYRPPPDPLRTAPDTYYVRQLQFVDTLVGRITDALARRGDLARSWVVVLSDHGYRFGGRERDPARVPFIVKAPGQVDRAEVRDPERAEQLLIRTVRDACSLTQ